MCAPALAHAFGFEEVAERAKAEAAEPYRASTVALPSELAQLDYDQTRDIRFRPERALWRRDGLPFELMFFHLGGYHTEPVRVHEITPEGVRPVGFDPKDFDYGKNRLSPSRWPDIGLAGFRVHYALNTPAYKDELAVFLGASYFRALGGGQRYGLSARGLAIDTVGAPREEFPRFKEFWIERPAAGATSLTIYALLDSPRASGAYRFTLHPGAQTRVDVKAALYLRAGVSTLGIAPLTSMFQHGENNPRRGEFRPEVHDSDGLAIAAGDGAGGSEWLWRPLVNPSRALVSSFAVAELKGFGLMQRDRAFSNYEDVEARYELRPGAWVVPEGDWGPGRVQLLQLPTPDETHDNIVAHWTPDRMPPPGEPLAFAYRLHFQGDAQQRPPNGWTLQSRLGRGYAKLAPDEFQYVVDFAGPALDALAADAAVDAVVTPVANARLIERNAYRNDARGGWRMTLRVQRLDPTQPVELRAFLQHGSHALTETWTTLTPPD
ncbi:glucan biosynthesis protein G [Piscinibacter sp.]|uniref:glucan biosynthesis protein G n=1 Tax=Piscinibacter sp. TaxID=1903157 RepID=UPI002CFD67A2|nr:glucan biosynthesis protein G [Albitalea sp.]HUG25376.1 glucan biosynthesis protein G [Albitalea sp.]